MRFGGFDLCNSDDLNECRLFPTYLSAFAVTLAPFWETGLHVTVMTEVPYVKRPLIP